MKKENWTEEYRQMIYDCEDRESKLSEWETNFIDSIHDQLRNKNSLTPKQIETLDNIWEKVTKNG